MRTATLARSAAPCERVTASLGPSPSHAAVMPALDAKDYLLLALAAFALFYIVRMTMAVRAEHAAAPTERIAPDTAGIAIGFISNFFDTLGIGSFATTTAMWRALKKVRDEMIPGTLNVGHTPPTIVQAYIFTKLVPVEPMTLILMIAAAVVGAWLGASVVSGWSRRRVQLGMGSALLAAATLMLLAQLQLIPAGGTAIGLEGPKLLIGLVGNFVLGVLMTIGIGLYAPCMILIYLLGMNPLAAFPIMMGSCAFLMPVASSRFMRARRFDVSAALGLLVGGIPAVLIAALIVKSLPLYVVRWLVVIVVVYTAVGMLRAAARDQAGANTAPAQA